MSGSPAYETGRMVGSALGPILLIVGGYFLGRYLGRKKSPPGFVSWPVIVAVVLVAISLLVPRQARGAEVVLEAADGR